MTVEPDETDSDSFPPGIHHLWKLPAAQGDPASIHLFDALKTIKRSLFWSVKIVRLTQRQGAAESRLKASARGGSVIGRRGSQSVVGRRGSQGASICVICLLSKACSRLKRERSAPDI